MVSIRKAGKHHAEEYWKIPIKGIFWLPFIHLNRILMPANQFLEHMINPISYIGMLITKYSVSSCFFRRNVRQASVVRIHGKRGV